MREARIRRAIRNHRATPRIGRRYHPIQIHRTSATNCPSGSEFVGLAGHSLYSCRQTKGAFTTRRLLFSTKRAFVILYGIVKSDSGSLRQETTTITIHTVGCKSFPDFAGTGGDIPVNSYNRPYQLGGRSHSIACSTDVTTPGSVVGGMSDDRNQRASLISLPTGAGSPRRVQSKIAYTDTVR